MTSRKKPGRQTTLWVIVITLLFGGFLSQLHHRSEVAFGAEGQGDRPNIVLIVADDLGWNDVGYHGSELATPNIDRLAATSVQIDRFYAKSSCTASRAALMTGVHPFRYGMATNVIQPWDRVGLPLNRTTIAEVLKQEGYSTAMVGKWHLGHWQQSFLPRVEGSTVTTATTAVTSIISATITFGVA